MWARTHKWVTDLCGLPLDARIFNDQDLSCPLLLLVQTSISPEGFSYSILSEWVSREHYPDNWPRFKAEQTQELAREKDVGIL